MDMPRSSALGLESKVLKLGLKISMPMPQFPMHWPKSMEVKPRSMEVGLGL